MKLPNAALKELLDGGDTRTGEPRPPLLNIGVGSDITIRELAEVIGKVVGYKGEILFDTTKPDGTPRKLLDVSRMSRLGWQASTELEAGLLAAYKAFVSQEARAS
jgi:GDP-L-fucose synthase